MTPSSFSLCHRRDRLKGYLSFLKIGPKILRLVPGKKAADVRTWLEVYSYWNQGGLENVVSLFLLLAQRFRLVDEPVADPLKVRQAPCVHACVSIERPQQLGVCMQVTDPFPSPSSPCLLLLL